MIGVMVTLDNGVGTQWYRVRTFGEAARLVRCGPGEIVCFNHMTEQEYTSGGVQ